MDLPAPVVGPPDATTREQQKSGPFIDRLFALRLDSGRSCVVTSFSAEAIYAGLLEGGMDAEYNARTMQAWAKRALDRHGEPLSVVPPVTRPLPRISLPRRPRVRLPWMVCMTSMLSDPIDPRMVHSALTVLWGQDPSDEPVTEWIRRAVADVEWERHARDCDLP